MIGGIEQRFKMAKPDIIQMSEMEIRKTAENQINFPEAAPPSAKT